MFVEINEKTMIYVSFISDKKQMVFIFILIYFSNSALRIQRYLKYTFIISGVIGVIASSILLMKNPDDDAESPST